MRLTKYGHACVRLDTLVIDPGVFTEPEALTGATAVLVTHEHEDHVDAEKLAAARRQNPDLAVYAPTEVAASLGDWATPVTAGDTVSAAGRTVRAVGGRHAEIVDGLPGCANLGYLVDGVYHPGDSLFVPDAPVATLLVPVAGPWLHTGQAVEFVRAVRPARAVAIHDAALSEVGLDNVAGWLETFGGAPYSRLRPGESIELPETAG